MPETSFCTTCKKTKPITAFLKRNTGFCKKCRNAYLDKRREQFKNSIPNQYPNGLKQCQVCKKPKPTEDFHVCLTNKDHLHTTCKRCRIKQGAKYALKRKYGISLKDYIKIYKEQNKVCKICGSNKDNRIINRWTPLDVDHCHETGEVRGLLCNGCNCGIFWIERLIKLNSLATALDYLNSHSCSTTSIPNQSTV